MSPAFGLFEAKNLLPCFMDCATKVRGLHLHPILKAGSDPGH